ncbi:MAG: delta-60 repeat domain-containing protein [Flavobacteriales bacterium]|nr:delta-60 repeat domain-containing protein [Flavobacteriales bacterium]
MFRLNLSLFAALIALLSASISYGQTVNPIPIGTNGIIYDTAIDDGIMYIGGQFSGVGNEVGGLAHFTDPAATDVPDPGFPRTNAPVRVAIPDGNGGWFLGGDFSTIGDIPQAYLAHVLQDQTVDPSFTLVVNGPVNALALDGSDLYVGGQFSDIGGQLRANLAKLNSATGSVSVDWTPEPNAGINRLVVFGEKLYVGGTFSAIAGRQQVGLALLNKSTGTIDANHISLESGSATEMVRSGDKLYVCNPSSGGAGYSARHIAGLTSANDSPALSFPEANGPVRCLANDGLGGWYVGGEFTEIGGQPNSYLAHVLSNGTIDPGIHSNGEWTGVRVAVGKWRTLYRWLIHRRRRTSTVQSC